MMRLGEFEEGRYFTDKTKIAEAHNFCSTTIKYHIHAKKKLTNMYLPNKQYIIYGMLPMVKSSSFYIEKLIWSVTRASQIIIFGVIYTEMVQCGPVRARSPPLLI